MPLKNIPFNNNWLYSPKFIKDSTKTDFDDSAFELITVPHTNKILPWHSFNDKEYQFISIYRKHFKVPLKYNRQRIFIDFEGVLLASTIYLNGKKIGQYKGGFTPFSFELTKHLLWGKDNVLAVKVDSRERSDIPPFGHCVDYMVFGGVYREVQLRVVNQTFIENIFAKPANVLKKNRKLSIKCFLNNQTQKYIFEKYSLEAILYDNKKKLYSKTVNVSSLEQEIILQNLSDIELWDIEKPKLYNLVVILSQNNKPIDQFSTRVGFRKAHFTSNGFFLNGKKLKLRGLNRHQTYPFIGAAAPEKLQRNDALLLKNELKCNIVRTSHYPQSRHFLNCCDEIGLLVFEEIPGWQHLGDSKWKMIVCNNVKEMIERDWNHPSIILWGVRVNESFDEDELYKKTNKIAHQLDDSRQTTGVRYLYDSNLLEDVFAYNEFSTSIIAKPNHPNYLISEYAGHMFPTKSYDNSERRVKHTLFHANILNQAYANKKIAGSIGWCAFDYNTHLDFGAGDRICYHGVCDIFRNPKPAAYLYKSQCDTSDEVVLEPIFTLAPNDSQDSGIGLAVICSNCDTIKVYIGSKLLVNLKPNSKEYPSLPRPPFCTDKITRLWGAKWDDLILEGYIKNEKVITKKLSNNGFDEKFIVNVDDSNLIANGIDMTRCSFYVADKYNNKRPYSTASISFNIEGPGEIIGEAPFALVGGCGAVWIKSKQRKGLIKLSIKHPYLDEKIVKIRAK